MMPPPTPRRTSNARPRAFAAAAAVAVLFAAVLLADLDRVSAGAAVAPQTPGAETEWSADDFDMKVRRVVTRRDAGVLACLFYDGSEQANETNVRARMVVDAVHTAAVRDEVANGLIVGAIDVTKDKPRHEVFVWYASVGDEPPKPLPYMHLFRPGYPLGLGYSGNMEAQEMYEKLYEYRAKGGPGGKGSTLLASAYRALRWTLGYMQYEFSRGAEETRHSKLVLASIGGAYCIISIAVVWFMCCRRRKAPKTKKKRS